MSYKYEEEIHKVDKLVEKCKPLLGKYEFGILIHHLRDLHRRAKRNKQGEENYRKRKRKYEYSSDEELSSSSDEEDEEERERSEPDFADELGFFTESQRTVVRLLLKKLENINTACVTRCNDASNDCAGIYVKPKEDDDSFLRQRHVEVMITRNNITVSVYADQFTPPPSLVEKKISLPQICLSREDYVFEKRMINRIVRSVEIGLNHIVIQAKFIEKEQERISTLNNELAELREEVQKIKKINPLS